MLIVGLLSIFIGLALGLMGGGGSILAVPVLTYVAHVDAKVAIATSLLVVGTTALFSLIGHARKGNVAWKTGLAFAASASVGAFGGGWVAGFIPGQVLLLLFAAMMLVTSVAMFKGRKEDAAVGDRKVPLVGAAAMGLGIGGLTGLVGAGGGFLIVPALVLLGRMEMHRAVGTSLFVIALNSAAGFAGHASHVTIDYQLAGVVIAGAIAGALVGSQLAHLVPGKVLRKGFAWFVLAMAGYMLWREAGPAWALGTTLPAAGVLTAIALSRDRTAGEPNPAQS